MTHILFHIPTAGVEGVYAPHVGKRPKTSRRLVDLLNRLKDESGLEVNDLAERTGFHRSTVTRHLKGESGLNYKGRRAYAKAFAVDMDDFENAWLDRGRPSARHRSHRGIPIINKTPAGEVVDYEDLGHNHYSYVPVAGELSDPDAFGVEVVGDSMQPTFREGDRVIFAPSLAPVDGDPVFVRFGSSREDGCTFKRFAEVDEERVMLYPENTDYKKLVVRKDEIERMAPMLFHQRDNPRLRKT